MTKSLASSADVMVSCVGMKMLCFESQSTMTRMVLKPEDGGSFSMKSMEMEFQGHSGIGSCFKDDLRVWNPMSQYQSSGKGFFEGFEGFPAFWSEF